MNLSEPLDGLMSAVEAAAIRVLGRADSGFSGRRVHALAGVGSTSSVHRALTRLVEVGVVTAASVPPAIVYRANRDHVLWPAIEAVLGARARVFDAIGAYVRKNAPPAALESIRVIVFGSVARGDSHLSSDVDLFVVLPEDLELDERAGFLAGLGEHVELLTGNAVQIVAVGFLDLAQRDVEGDPFLADVVAEGIRLFGSPLPLSGRKRVA